MTEPPNGREHHQPERRRSGNPLILIAAFIGTITAVTAIAWGASSAFGLPSGIDAAVTVVLFVLTTPLVGLAAVVGMWAGMLGDGYPKSWISNAAALLAMLGPLVGVIAIEVGSMILAARADGLTFYYPLAATGLSILAIIGCLAIGSTVVQTFR